MAKTKTRPRPAQRTTVTTGAPRDGVVIAYIHPGEVSGYFLESMLQSVIVGSRRGWLTNIMQEWSSANVSASRNAVTERFLARPEGEWLFWVDADMAFEWDAIERLLAVADPKERPIVGGLAFGMMEGKPLPTIYQWAQLPDGLTTVRVREYERDALVQVAATGAACLLIHRSVLDAMRDRKFSRAFPFFQETELLGKPVGEDITFCIRAGILGFPVFVHTGVEFGHHKSTVLTQDTFDEAHPVPSIPADAGLVIPTRGDHPELLRAILAASGVPDERVVIVDGSRPDVNIHRWWNEGIDDLAARGVTQVAVLNDDVVIGPDTLPKLFRGLSGHTLAVLDEPGASGHCWALDLRDGVRPDEAYRWWCGDLQLHADAETKGRGVARVVAWCLHLHANEATTATPELEALADVDAALYDRRHPKGSRFERVPVEEP